jgi:hypothetical protein
MFIFFHLTCPCYYVAHVLLNFDEKGPFDNSHYELLLHQQPRSVNVTVLLSMKITASTLNVFG